MKVTGTVVLRLLANRADVEDLEDPTCDLRLLLVDVDAVIATLPADQRAALLKLGKHATAVAEAVAAKLEGWE